MVVGRWLGPVALGLYSRAYQLMAVPTALFGDVFDKVLFPTLSRVQHDPRRLTSGYLQGIAVVGLVTFPAGLVAAVLAPELVASAFGNRWTALVQPFQVLALGMMFRTSSRVSDSVSRATGKVYRRAWRQAFYAALVFLGAWFGQRHGLVGVAVGVLGALFFHYLLMAHLCLGVLGIRWLSFIRVQLPSLWLGVAVSAATLAIVSATRHLGVPPLAGLVVGLLAAIATAMLSGSLIPSLVLGEHGMRMRETLRSYWVGRLRPIHIRKSF
jgi:PST family polysaccharide transporter